MKRNIDRFPDDFMFQLTYEEFEILRNHVGASSQWGGRRYPPYAFTEHGVAMLSSILNSPRAIKVNIEIMRIFSRLRRLLATHTELERKIAGLEKKYDAQFKMVFDAIRELMIPPEPKEKDTIGYLSESKNKAKACKSRQKIAFASFAPLASFALKKKELPGSDELPGCPFSPGNLNYRRPRRRLLSAGSCFSLVNPVSSV